MSTATVSSSEMAVNATRLDFISEANGKAYRLFISAPPGPPPASGWPVVWLIDGNLHFGITVDTAQIQARWPDTRDAVIVGVGYPTDSVTEALTVRNHDLTPPTPEDWSRRGWQANMGMSHTAFGGIEAYLAMLTREAPRHLAQVTSVDPRNSTLMGHSLGGLTTLASFLRRPDAFRNHVAISPSIWMTDAWVLQFVDPFIQRAKTVELQARLLITAGQFEEGVPPFPPLPRSGAPMSQETYEAMTLGCRMVSNARDLAERLAPLAGRGVHVEFAVHAGEDHRSVVPAGIARGVYFSLYRPT